MPASSDTIDDAEYAVDLGLQLRAEVGYDYASDLHSRKSP